MPDRAMSERPEPRDDPEVEPGEDAGTHLLPTFDRLRAMTPDERDDLRDRVADWIGWRVEQFRERVAALEREDMA